MKKPADPRHVVRLVGLRLVELRQLRDLTQEALAERADISVRQMQRLEAGSTNPTLLLLATLADALNVEPRALFDSPSRATHRRPGRPRTR